MRIMTLNLNGIRSACAKGFWTWASRQRVDVICLQELKAHRDVIPVECREPKGWYAHYVPAVRPGYSGVGILSRKQPDRVVEGVGVGEIDEEGRYLRLDFGPLSVVSLYLPSGSSGAKRQAMKFRCLDYFRIHLQDLQREGREFVVCGDFNIAHREIDLKNWKSNQKNSGFLPEERAWMDWLFSDGAWVDAFRTVNQQPDQYTWWSQRGRAYENNVGWRIDYHVVTPGLRDTIKKASIYRDTKFSDHAPLTIDYDYPW